MAHIPTLNLNENDGDAFRRFIQDIRNTTGFNTVGFLSKGGFKFSKRAAFVGEVPVKDWVFIVRHKLYLVAIKVPNKEWIALDGQYPEHVIKCLDLTFPVRDEVGNKIPPYQATLGTSYRSLTGRSGIRRENLKLNRETLIIAVRGLTDAYLNIDNSIRVPVLTLIQMIPEAVRIEPMLSFICEYYTHNDLATPSLPVELIIMQGSWTKISRAIARTTYGMPFKEIRLKTGRSLRDVETAMAMVPYTRAVTQDELNSG